MIIFCDQLLVAKEQFVKIIKFTFWDQCLVGKKKIVRDQYLVAAAILTSDFVCPFSDQNLIDIIFFF